MPGLATNECSTSDLSDSSAASDGYESALAEPLRDSDDDMESMLLANQGGADDNAAHALLHRLALRVRAAAAGGPQDAGGFNSPQLNPARQHQVDMLRMQQRLQHQMQHGLQVQRHMQQVRGLHQLQHLQQVQQDATEAEANVFKYACRHCPERFTHVNLMTRHVHDVHPVAKPFLCPGCGRGYVVREVMEAHYLMVHAGERPYPCDQCSKCFSRREYLKTHRRVHTGIKPYECGDCGRSFAWKNCLDIHMRTHTGERPYLCTTCSRDFATQSTLKMHKMIHSNSFPFPCTLAGCHRQFRRSHQLRYHSQYHEKQSQVEVDSSRTEDQVAAAVLNEL